MDAGGFSIRGYTSAMRYVNVYKCWPFPIDDHTREDIESQLPPMEVPNRSSNHQPEAEAINQLKDEDISPSEGDLQPPQPPSLHRVKRELSPIGDDNGEKLGMARNFQLFDDRLHTLRSNVQLAKEEMNLNSVKKEEDFEMVCPICRIFKTMTEMLMDKHISDCLAKKRWEEERKKRPSLNHTLKTRRRRTLTEIFNLHSEIEGVDDKNGFIEKSTVVPK